MDNLLILLLEDIVENKPSVYSFDNNVDTAKSNLSNYMKERIDAYDKMSKIIASQMNTLAINKNEIKVPEDFPYYGINNVRNAVNFPKIIRHAWILGTDGAISDYIIKELSMQLIGKEKISYDELYNDIIGETVGDEKTVDASVINDKVNYLKNSLIDRIEILNTVKDEITTLYAESQNKVQTGAVIFSEICKFIATMAKINVYLYNKLYSLCKSNTTPLTPSEAALSNSQVTYDAILKSVDDTNKAQCIWKERHGAENPEFSKRLDILNEKLTSSKEDIDKKQEYVDSENKESATKIAEDLIECVKKCFGVKTGYQYNEYISEDMVPKFIKDGNLEETINWVKDKLSKKEKIAVVLFPVSNANSRIYEELKTSFFPKLKEIVESYDDFEFETDDKSEYLVCSIEYDMNDDDDDSKDEYEDKDDDDEKKTMCEETIPTSVRKELADCEFGIPAKRSFPLTDESHIRSAITMFRYAKNGDKTILAKNIKNKIIEKHLVGKIRIGKNNTYRKYFPTWMYDDAVVTANYDGDSYQILNNNKVVAHGTVTKCESKLNESASDSIFDILGDTYI